jgi:signal transduction histidine kinase
MYLPLVFWLSLRVYLDSELAHYLNHDFVQFNLRLCKGLLLIASVLLLAGLIERRRRRDWPLLSHLLAQGFTVCMVYSAWVAGFYTSNGSLLIVAGLALGLPLLESRVVFLALVTGIVTAIALVVASQTGFLSYAPLFDVLPFSGDYVSPTWAVSQFILIINTVCAIWVIMASLIKRWRQREQDLLAEMETQEKLAVLGEFSARIIHQTRHQLGLMGISIHRLRQQLESGEVDLALVRAELDNLNDAQHKLRLGLKEDLTIDPSGELEDQRTIREIIEEEIDNLRGLASQQGKKIRLVCNEKLSSQLRPQFAEEWGQGFFNVLDNAIFAATRQVQVITDLHDAKLVIRVLDDGSGIPPELMSHVLQPFVTSKTDGNGMGLAIALGVARKEGGSLRLENRPEGGLSVILELPAST